MIWAVWRDAGGNLGVTAYPDTQLARYASSALGRTVLSVGDSRSDALERMHELEERFSVAILPRFACKHCGDGGYLPRPEPTPCPHCPAGIGNEYATAFNVISNSGDM